MPNTVFAAIFISLLMIIFMYIVARPRYSNRLPDGRSFSKEKLKRLKDEREINNPHHERVGEKFGRCKFCGHQHEKSQRHSFTLNLLESNNICSCCHLTRVE